jgi:hypothetical protein
VRNFSSNTLIHRVDKKITLMGIINAAGMFFIVAKVIHFCIQEIEPKYSLAHRSDFFNELMYSIDVVKDRALE